MNTLTPRWPIAECLHQHTRGPYTIRNHQGEHIRTVPQQCLDCHAKHTPEGWTP